MRTHLRRFWALSLSASVLSFSSAAEAGDYAKPTPRQTVNRIGATRAPNVRLMPEGGSFRFTSGALRSAFQEENQQPPPEPPTAQPPEPATAQPPSPTTADTGLTPTGVEATTPSFAAIDVTSQQSPPPAGAPVGIAGGGEAVAQGAVDLGQLLHQSTNTETVDVQRRNPTAWDPNIRGYRQGQIYTQANGAYWLPARQDLDTMLSKIDPTMIESVVVLPGPYGVQYGPGLSFINIDTALTPRYECGPEHHVQMLGNVRTNGGQVYGRVTAFGGDESSGYRLSYGQKEGDDYLSGNDTQIPASFENRDVWLQYGFDINPEQRVELKYINFQQIDAEYPAQFFNIDDLITDGFEARIIDESPGPWSRMVVDSWWNRTRFNGDNFTKRNPNFREVDRTEFAVDSFLQDPSPGDDVFVPPTVRRTRIDAFTDGDVLNTGTRAMATFGERDDVHLNVGTDFRYIEQNINEQIFVNTLQPFPIRTNLPRSWAVDPGLFAEYGVPWTDYWTVKVGSRVDFYTTDAEAEELLGGFPSGELEQHDELFASYITSEVEIDCNWTGVASFGFGERAPTLIERYANALFLGVAQSGFTRVIGVPTLDKETDYQLDVGLRAEYDDFRGHIGAYHAWVEDYVTLQGSIVRDPFFQSARLFNYVNTPLATLAGFELGGEYDWSCYLSPFASMKYVDGRDREINAPLTQIPPLDTTLGVRLHEPSQQRLWSIEFAARIVDNQDRLGTVRAGDGTVDVIEEQTPGFTVWHLRSYYNYSNDLSFVAGIENVFDRNYQEHLDLRLLGPAGYPFDATRVLSPGITPYFGVNWTF